MSGVNKSSAKSHQMQSLRMPLLQAFREHARSGDGRKRGQGEGDGPAGTSVNSSVSNEAMLRESLDLDLGHLLNTVNLASVMDLSGYARVSKSTLNFGMNDLVHMTTDQAHVGHLSEALRDVLLAHEPRLDKHSLKIVRHDEVDELNQRVAFTVQADMLCHPVDIPLEFVAEMDVGSGKVDLRNLGRNKPQRRARNPEANAARPGETGTG